MTEPRLGDFFVTKTPGLMGGLIRVVTKSPVNHAGVYIGDGRILEADPLKGFKQGWAHHYPDAIWSGDYLALTGAERTRILLAATSLKGIKYNFLDIFALGAAAYGVSNSLVNKRIEKMNRLICSQAVDRAYELAGLHLFDDGRLHSQVTPGDLYKLLTDVEYYMAVHCHVPRKV